MTIYFKESLEIQNMSKKKKQLNREISEVITEKVKNINKVVESLPHQINKNKMMELIRASFSTDFRDELLDLCQKRKI